MKSRFSLNRILFGLMVIGIGVLFLLKQTGYLDYEIGDLNVGYIFSTFWPVILIWIGLKGMFSGMASRNGSGFGGSLILLLGILFLGHNLGWFAWSLSEIFMNLWPVAIILFGLRLLLKPRNRRGGEQPGDDWKPYGRFDDHYDVPPAPPLHPDPTKPMDEFGGNASGNAENGRAGEEPAGSHKNDRAANDGMAEENRHAESGGTAKDSGSGPYFDHENLKRRSKAYNRHTEHLKDAYKRAHEHHLKHAYKRTHERHFKNAYKRSYKEEYWSGNDGAQCRSGFIGDIHIGHDYWELKPLNISHFIGDTILDLTKAQICPGETKVHISSFIGDVKVYVPNDPDIGIQVVSSAFVGDVKILGQNEGGLFRSVNVHSPSYQDTDKKIKLIVSTFLGDVRVTKVG